MEVTVMSYIDFIKEKAKADRKTIVLPETTDKRTLIAASHILKEGIADIIMLGETRDLESAEMAVQASLTGHLVFTTLHTNDAAGAVTRLIDMGVEPFLITSSLIAVLGQRLIRRICPACKTAFTPTDEDLKLLNLERENIGDNPFYYGKGCPLCNNTGYKGRKAITEILVMNPKLNDLVLQSSPTIVIREKARELGMETMREDGIRAILHGETTMEEILKYT